ncbi:hypothetical protein [Bacillus sp. FJAT-45350]|uniref:hypothetical protein n=1 Tax=Bacillus sp. FJAT-45350 TaxID=2011014 RepID=UPI000BB73DB3|nr:hypothetical protein [Bacillus sp. FJAT-45350]
MIANSMRSFAGGLVVAGSLLGSVYFFGSSDSASTQVVERLSLEEMKQLVAEEGYLIHSEEEWQTQLDEAKEIVTEVVEVEAEVNNEQVDEKIIYRTILTVSPGMTSIDVGEALVAANIIDRAMVLVNEVEKRGLANNLRPGSYEVESEMSLDMVIEKIFK